MPILTARLPVEERIKERWATYGNDIDEGGHDEADQGPGCWRRGALWRNVYVAESDAQAEDGLIAAFSRRRAPHDARARSLQSRRLSPRPSRRSMPGMTDPKVPDSEAIPFITDQLTL